MTEQVEQGQLREAFLARYRIGDFLSVMFRPESENSREIPPNRELIGFLKFFSLDSISLANYNPLNSSVGIPANVCYGGLVQVDHNAELFLPYGSIISCRKMVPDEASGIELKVNEGDGK